MRSVFALLLVTAAVVPGAGCGGCGGDDSSDGPFELVSQTPEPDADNVYVRDPIVLEFSHPVDRDTVGEDSIALEAGGQPVAYQSEVSEDGTTVTLLVSEPPATPAVVTVSVGEGLRDEDGAAFEGASWSFTLPVWQRSPAGGPIRDGSRPQLVAGPGGAPVVGWIDSGGTVEVRQMRSDGPADLGLAARGADLTMAGDGSSAAVAFIGDGGILVGRWNGEEWEDLGSLPIDGAGTAPLFDVAIDGDGNPVVAVHAGGGVAVARWDGGALVDESPLEEVAAVGALALAVDGTRAVLAVIGGAGDLRTFRQADGGWEELAGGVDFTAAERPDVTAAGGVIALSWQKDDAGPLATRHAYAARWSDAGWLRLAHAADLDIQADAIATSIAIAGEQATMAWVEGDGTSRKVYAARATSDDESWRFLDSAVNQSPAADATDPAIAFGPGGDPMVAFNQDGDVVLARWNGSPTTRPGLAERLPAGDCAIPEDALPATLAETGCYADVAGHQLAAQLIPFEINSPLWSDGALKRRFLLIPDGQSMGATDAGALTMPVGTLLVKEFWLERIAEEPTSRFPVETRFLVKRCEEGDCIEPWQGYSYRWNPEGTEADLIDPGSADERTEWTVTSAGGAEVTHSHIYPARLNCTRCHNAPSGRVLGLQLIQLDRPVRYGEVVADQLDTLMAVGVLAGSSGNAAVTRLPSSLDPSFDYQSRSRAYYHSNCAQCHRPGGERPTIDLRFQAPLAADNICNQLTPGNGTGSSLYVKDATRGAGQMPPLATDLPDSYQLATTAAWIDGMATCP